MTLQSEPQYWGAQKIWLGDEFDSSPATLLLGVFSSKEKAQNACRVTQDSWEDSEDGTQSIAKLKENRIYRVYRVGGK